RPVRPCVPITIRSAATFSANSQIASGMLALSTTCASTRGPSPSIEAATSPNADSATWCSSSIATAPQPSSRRRHTRDRPATAAGSRAGDGCGIRSAARDRSPSGARRARAPRSHKAPRRSGTRPWPPLEPRSPRPALASRAVHGEPVVEGLQADPERVGGLLLVALEVFERGEDQLLLHRRNLAADRHLERAAARG